MPYNTQLSDRIREIFSDLSINATEKEMFGGICFMVDNKMCAGVVRDEVMCRVGPHVYEQSLSEAGCREMQFTGKPMKGYVFVNADAVKTREALRKWISRCLAFNPEARASAKKRGRLSGRRS